MWARTPPVRVPASLPHPGRGARADEWNGLENRRASGFRGFESRPLRQERAGQVRFLHAVSRDRPSAGYERPGTGQGERVSAVHHANVAIVRLGALCELESSTPSQANFRVSEYAVLDDGSEIVLHSERGYSAGVPRCEQADVWQHMTVEGIERDVMTMVLPDDEMP